MPLNSENVAAQVDVDTSPQVKCQRWQNIHYLSCGHIYNTPESQPCGTNCMHAPAVTQKSTKKLGLMNPPFLCFKCLTQNLRDRYFARKGKFLVENPGFAWPINDVEQIIRIEWIGWQAGARILKSLPEVRSHSEWAHLDPNADFEAALRNMEMGKGQPPLDPQVFFAGDITQSLALTSEAPGTMEVDDNAVHDTTNGDIQRMDALAWVCGMYHKMDFEEPPDCDPEAGEPAQSEADGELSDLEASLLASDLPAWEILLLAADIENLFDEIKGIASEHRADRYIETFINALREGVEKAKESQRRFKAGKKQKHLGSGQTAVNRKRSSRAS